MASQTFNMADDSTTCTEGNSIEETREQNPQITEKRDDDPENPITQIKSTDQIPDGGLLAWMTVMGAWCTSFCSYGWLNSIGVFQDYYEQNLLKQYSASTIAWIPSLQIFFMMGSAVVVGRIYDRYGPRYLLLVGTFLHVFGLMMTSLSTKYYQILLAQGICSAIGASATFQPAISVVRQWFHKKRGAAFGLVSTGSSVGGVIFPIMLNHLVSELGYAWAMRISAFLILFLLTIANLTVRTRVPHKPEHTANFDHLQPFREVAYVLFMMGFLLIAFGVFVPINYIVVDAHAAGMGSYILQYLVPVLNAASFFGRSSAGFMADKFGPFNVFVVVCAITGVLTLGLWIPASNNAALISFAGFFGYFSGAYIGLPAALVAQLSPYREFGYRTGLVFAVGSIGGLFTNPIAGAIVQSENGSYTGLKIFAGVFCLVGTALAFAARVSKTGFKLVTKY